MENSDEDTNEYYTKLLESLTLDDKRAVTHIMIALKEAKEKHPDPWAINTKSKVYDHCYAASIVGEEAGELLQMSMQHEHEGKDRMLQMIREASQTGATVIRFIVNTLKHQAEPKGNMRLPEPNNLEE